MDLTHAATHAPARGRGASSPAHPLRLIAAPAVITLAITLLRLTGELRGWAPAWFGADPGGGAAVVGIGWLIPLFGAWFGWRLARAGARPASTARAILLPLAGLVLVAGTFYFVVTVAGTTTLGFAITLTALPLCSLLALPAWPALWRTNLAYGLAARLAVVVVTVIAVSQGWNTHYEKLAPGSPAVSAAARTAILAGAQIGIWVPLTILLGGLTGGIAAAVARRPR
jgi:hypothetical protein